MVISGVRSSTGDDALCLRALGVAIRLFFLTFDAPSLGSDGVVAGTSFAGGTGFFSVKGGVLASALRVREAGEDLTRSSSGMDSISALECRRFTGAALPFHCDGFGFGTEANFGLNAVALAILAVALALVLSFRRTLGGASAFTLGFGAGFDDSLTSDDWVRTGLVFCTRAFDRFRGLTRRGWGCGRLSGEDTSSGSD